MRSPVADRGSSCRKTSRSRNAGTTFSIPASVISTRGSVRHIRALPSDSTTQTDPVSATRKFAPLNPMGTRRNFSRRIVPRRGRQVLRLAAEPGQAHAALEDVADLHAVPVQRGHHDVRGPVAPELDDQIGEVGLEGRDAGGFQRDVQPRLVRGHRLDLDDLAAAVRSDDVDDDAVRFVRIGAPSARGRPRACSSLRTARDRYRDGEGRGP